MFFSCFWGLGVGLESHLKKTIKQLLIEGHFEEVALWCER